jgi:hypothetical protein
MISISFLFKAAAEEIDFFSSNELFGSDVARNFVVPQKKFSAEGKSKWVRKLFQ